MKALIAAYKIMIFLHKSFWVKIFHISGFSLSSFKSLTSRCRWTTEVSIVGKSKMKLGVIECAPNTRLASTAGGNLIIGNHCYFNRNCTVNSRKQISIGGGSTFGPNVCIFDHDHGFGKNGQTGEFKLGTIEIGENCWIGAGTVILRDTCIGNNCVIGAGCIVKGIIPDNSLVLMDRQLIIKPLHD